MTPTATYIAEENCLQLLPNEEAPLMPDLMDYNSSDDYIDAKSRYSQEVVAYNAHLATLRKIPCSPEPGFKDREKYTEGVDYEIKGAGDWKWCYQLKGNIFAAPIVPVKSEPDMPNLILTAEQEAEKLYPIPDNVTGQMLTYFQIETKLQRSAHITCARQYMDEIEKLKDVLHIDQTGLAAGLAEVNKIVEGYRWVTEGRGPYEWNDDKYKEEMSNMLDNISEAATKALNSSGAIAHSVCCGKEGRTATMEGIGYVKQDFHDKEIEKLKAENSKMRKALEEIAQKYADAEVLDDIGQFVFEMGDLATTALK